MTIPHFSRSDTDGRLAAFAERHPGMSTSTAAALLIEEGLRMDEHPGVLFRDGPAGRRAVLAGGPDVWEVVRAVDSARASAPDLNERAVLSLVSENTGVAFRQIAVALDYATNYPDELGVLLCAADEVENPRG